MGGARAVSEAMTLGTRAAIAFLAAGTTFFTLLSWGGLSEDSSTYLVPLFWVCLLVAGTGLALRARRVAGPLVVLVQALVVVLVVHQYWAVGGVLNGWVPTESSLSAVGRLLGRAVTETNQYAAPMPVTATHFPALMLAAGAAIAISVDLLACTVRRVPLAGLPLLAAFTAPVSLIGGVSWVTFALASGCFVLLLAADQAARLGRWGRSLSGPVTDSLPSSVGLNTVWPTATRIGVAGIAVAVLTPAVLPTADGLLGGGDGFGPGSGGNEVTIEDPMLNLRRDLHRGEDVDLLRVTTDDPDPRYLRVSVLDEFTGAAWLPAERDIPTSNVADGPLPDAPGLDPDVRTTSYDWSISVGDQFDSIWLPVPYPASEVHAAGDWRYDVRTLDVMTPDERTSTRGLTYTAVGEQVEVDPAKVVSAPPPNRNVFIDETRLPASVPSWFKELAEKVTADSHSQFERAVRLQDWFREDGGFQYSIERSGEGNGTRELELFLGTGDGSKVGYCEQFAAAMAVLARSLAIPARVAVGFLRPDRVADAWVYSAYDMHAWPELYFEGVGWVRFEPTPAQEGVAAPAYTGGRLPAPDELTTPSTSASADRPDAAPTPTQRPDGSAGGGGGSPVLRWLGIAVLVIVVLALLALPAGLRVLARRRRLEPARPGGVAEGGWGEVRATALDLRLGWDDGATLRRRARAIVPLLAPPSHGPAEDTGHEEDPAPGEPVSPVEALQRLVLLVERSRFSRQGLPELAQEEVPGLVETVTAAMVRGVRPAVRRRATWLPASLWRGRRGSTPGRHGSSGDRLGELDRVSV